MIYPIATCEYFASTYEERRLAIEKIKYIIGKNFKFKIFSEKVEDRSNFIEYEDSVGLFIYDILKNSCFLKIDIYSSSKSRQSLVESNITRAFIKALLRENLCHVYSLQTLNPKKKIFSSKIKYTEEIILSGSKDACYLYILDLKRLINFSNISFNKSKFSFAGDFQKYHYKDFDCLINIAKNDKRFIDLIQLSPYQGTASSFLHIIISEKLESE